MRLFVGLFPAAPVRSDLRRALGDWPAAAGDPAGPARLLGNQSTVGVRLTPAEQWHVTLVFLGEVADERLTDVEKALDGVPGARRSVHGSHGHADTGAVSLGHADAGAVSLGRAEGGMVLLGRAEAGAVSSGRGIELRPAGAGRFENGGTSALWTGLAGDLAGLARLRADVHGAVAAAGLPADERAFRPHLTIAYVHGGQTRGRRDAARRDGLPAQLSRDLPAGLDGYVGPSWTVDEFVLARSRYDEGGGYDKLTAWAC